MITISIKELKEVIRRAESSGATHLEIEATVNCDTASVEKLYLNSMDKDWYLDTVWAWYED